MGVLGLPPARSRVACMPDAKGGTRRGKHLTQYRKDLHASAVEIAETVYRQY